MGDEQDRAHPWACGSTQLADQATPSSGRCPALQGDGVGHREEYPSAGSLGGVSCPQPSPVPRQGTASPGRNLARVFGIIELPHGLRGGWRELMVLCMCRAMSEAAAVHPEILLLGELQEQGQVGDGCLSYTVGTKDTLMCVFLTPQEPKGASGCSSAHWR